MQRGSILESTPLLQVSRELFEEVASEAASRAIREMRSERKLGRNDSGRASPALGDILLRYREDAGLTQRQLADLAGIHDTTIGKIETAQRGMSLATFAKLNRAFLDMDIDGFAVDVTYVVSGWD